MRKLAPIELAIEILGGFGPTAEALNVTRQTVYNWGSWPETVPPKYCRKIQALTHGRVVAEELRPDIFEVITLEDLNT